MFGQFSPATPEILLLIFLCSILVVDLFIEDEKRTVTYWLTIASLMITAWSVVISAPEGRTLLFDGSYVSDALSQVLKLGAIGIVGVGFLYARDYLRHNGLMKGEYYLLGLFGLLGMMIMISAQQHAVDVSRTRDAGVIAVRAGRV